MEALDKLISYIKTKMKIYEIEDVNENFEEKKNLFF